MSFVAHNAYFPSLLFFLFCEPTEKTDWKKIKNEISLVTCCLQFIFSDHFSLMDEAQTGFFLNHSKFCVRVIAESLNFPI